MLQNALIEPFELAENETGGAVVTGGLVNVTVTDVNVLNHNYTNVTVKDIANDLHLGVGA